jgi:acyl-CoA synthetase (AMP-forming)/AMP-acid ligase II
LGEVPVAVVHLKNGERLAEEELRAFLDGKLARFKIPERIIISAVPLPRLGTGKIDRRALKAQYAN